jgi:hypothetical protein
MTSEELFRSNRKTKSKSNLFHSVTREIRKLTSEEAAEEQNTIRVADGRKDNSH